MKLYYFRFNSILPNEISIDNMNRMKSLHHIIKKSDEYIEIAKILFIFNFYLELRNLPFYKENQYCYYGII